jgi:hypothetical protein
MKCMYNHPPSTKNGSANSAVPSAALASDHKSAEKNIEFTSEQMVEKDISDQLYLCDILLSEFSSLQDGNHTNQNFISPELLNCLKYLEIPYTQNFQSLLQQINNKKASLIAEYNAFMEQHQFNASPSKVQSYNSYSNSYREENGTSAAYDSYDFIIRGESALDMELREDDVSEDKDTNMDMDPFMSAQEFNERSQAAMKIQQMFRKWKTQKKQLEVAQYSVTDALPSFFLYKEERGNSFCNICCAQKQNIETHESQVTCH